MIYLFPATSAKMPTNSFTKATAMRTLSLILLGSLSVTCYAEKPNNLEPLPPPPAFDAGPDAPSDEPEVTIIKKTEQTVEEYRVGGKLYMIKIIPKSGPAYYMVDERGDGKFRSMESLDSGLRPPRWVLHRF